jgi:hypothetical protein
MKEPKWFRPCGDGWEPVPPTGSEEGEETPTPTQPEGEAKSSPATGFKVVIMGGPHGFGI